MVWNFKNWQLKKKENLRLSFLVVLNFGVSRNVLEVTKESKIENILSFNNF